MKFYQHLNKLNEDIQEFATISLDENAVFTIQVCDQEKKELFHASEKLADYTTYLIFHPANNGRHIYNGYAISYGSGIKLNNYIDIFFNKASMKNYYQLDTGSLARGECTVKSFVIPYSQTSFSGRADAAALDSYETSPVLRYDIWARYALVLPSGQEFKNEEYGRAVDGLWPNYSEQQAAILSLCEAQIDEAGLAYFPIAINKWDAKYSARLNQEIDNTVVHIQTTAGTVNTSRVELQHGTGSFRLYPYGYKGDLKLKFGYRYYNPWCEYTLTIV
ncbi:MAG: hypothetical protein E6X17_09855 [Sporomusaceae bacterium]|nr:hypothetical protein [Sporomusaceae bacterium]